MSRGDRSESHRAFRVVISPDAQRNLNGLEKYIRARIIRKLRYFASQENPLRYAKRLKPPLKDWWRFRVGEYRIVFRVGEDGEIRLLLILKVGHRKDVYG